MKYMYDETPITNLPPWLEDIIIVKVWDPGTGQEVSGTVVVISEQNAK